MNNNLNNNLKKLEQNQITFNQIFKKIDPSEFDMMFKEQRKDLIYGYDGRFNIYDDNLSKWIGNLIINWREKIQKTE